MATNNIFMGNQPRQFVKNYRHYFRDHIWPHHQGYNMRGCPDRHTHTHTHTHTCPKSVFDRIPSHIIALMIGTEMVPETSVMFKELTRLIAREDFLNIVAMFKKNKL